MEVIQVLATFIIIVAIIISAFVVSKNTRDINRKNGLISALTEEMQKARQLQLFFYDWPRKEKDLREDNKTPQEIAEYKKRSIEATRFRSLPAEITNVQQIKRPFTIKDDQSIECLPSCTPAMLGAYTECVEKVQNLFYREQIGYWKTIIVTAVLCSLVVLFSLTIAFDNGFGIVTAFAFFAVIIFVLYYFFRSFRSGEEVLPGELASKRFLGIPVGNIGQGRPFLLWKIESIVKVPSTDHTLEIGFEDVPVPVVIPIPKEGEQAPENVERIPNINLSITAPWRYQDATKALTRIGTGKTAEDNINKYLKGLIRSLINVHFADVNGDLKKIMEECGLIGEEIDRIIQEEIIGYWGIDIDPVAVEPDTNETITKARDDQAKSEYGIRTAQNDAKASVARLSANIKFLELLKGSKELAIDETTMKAIVVGTVLKDTIVGIGSKLNLFAADRGLLDSVFNLFGKPTGLPKGAALEKGIEALNPETAKKLAALYDMLMGAKEP